jgi:hypothetical protein
MDLGKPLKVVNVPLEQPARQPIELPATREDEGLIPLPADWPKRRSPVRVPEKVAEWQTK